MSIFTCKITDKKGTARFIAPLVTVTSPDGKKTVTVNGQAGLALQLSYVVMAMGEDSSKYQDKTKREAGTLVLDVLKGLPAESVLTFHHPIDDSDVNNFDQKLWIPIVSATAKQMLTVASALSKVDSIMQGIEDSVIEAVKSADGIKSVLINDLPVYFEGGKDSKRGKSAGGKKFTPITI